MKKGNISKIKEKIGLLVRLSTYEDRKLCEVLFDNPYRMNAFSGSWSGFMYSSNIGIVIDVIEKEKLKILNSNGEIGWVSAKYINVI
jgi:hypothetical protein